MTVPHCGFWSISLEQMFEGREGRGGRMDCFFFSAPTGFNSFLNILRISLNICQSSINILWLKVENVLVCFSSNIYLLLLLMPKPENEKIPAGIGFITVTLLCRLSLRLGGVCWIDLFIYFFIFMIFKKCHVKHCHLITGRLCSFLVSV